MVVRHKRIKKKRTELPFGDKATGMLLAYKRAVASNAYGIFKMQYCIKERAQR